MKKNKTVMEIWDFIRPMYEENYRVKFQKELTEAEIIFLYKSYLKLSKDENFPIDVPKSILDS